MAPLCNRLRFTTSAFAIGAVAILFSLLCVQAEVRLPALISDHMVIQANKPVTLWGWADAGEAVAIELGGKTAQATADDDGHWQVKLPQMNSGGPYVLSVRGSNQIEIKDVLIGEVWFCAGQSNMAMEMKKSANYEDFAAEANFPEIRHFNIATRASAVAQDDVKGEWVVCTPKTVGEFSGVAYHFARQLNRELQTPIGLINASWGNTQLHTWTPLDALLAEPDLAANYSRYLHISNGYTNDQIEAVKNEKKEWSSQARTRDPGISHEAENWANPSTDDSSWETCNLPGSISWMMKRDFDGAIWFRKTIEVPAELAGKELVLKLGRIRDFDITYLNGQQIGEVNGKMRGYWMNQREYVLTDVRLKTGRNVIAVRVFNPYGKDGFDSRKDVMSIYASDAPKQRLIDLSGEWRYKIEFEPEKDYQAIAASEPKPYFSANSYQSPANNFYGMVAPVTKYAIAGVIWYQGESNAGAGNSYRINLLAMVRSWRENWGLGDIPFYVVQLPNHKKRRNDVAVEHGWALTRDAQMGILELPNTGIVVTIDIGEAGDIHPKNKHDVGQRVGKLALAKAYEADPAGISPIYESMEVRSDGKAVIRLSDVHSELVSRDGMPLKGFAIAGSNKRFYEAEATVEGANTLIVFSHEVATPVAVRYAWKNNPKVNLYTRAGLPVTPFRTDDWKR